MSQALVLHFFKHTTEPERFVCLFLIERKKQIVEEKLS